MVERQVDGDDDYSSKVPDYLLKQLERKLVWDLFPHEDIEDYFNILEMIPSSDDVFAMEHRASHERMDQCVPLVPYVEGYVCLVNELFNRVLLDDVDLADDLKQQMHKQNLTVMRNGLYVVLYQLLDAEILTYGRKSKGE